MHYIVHVYFAKAGFETLQIHGPISGGFAEEKLERVKYARGAYLIRQSAMQYDKVSDGQFFQFLLKFVGSNERDPIWLILKMIQAIPVQVLLRQCNANLANLPSVSW